MTPRRVLRRLGERGDIVRTMQRAFGQEHRELSIYAPTPATPPAIERIAAAVQCVVDARRAALRLDASEGTGLSSGR